MKIIINNNNAIYESKNAKRDDRRNGRYIDRKTR